jgi:hypothetical protein
MAKLFQAEGRVMRSGAHGATGSEMTRTGVKGTEDTTGEAVALELIIVLAFMLNKGIRIKLGLRVQRVCLGCQIIGVLNLSSK